MTTIEIFKNRKLAIATKHAKERVIASAIRKSMLRVVEVSVQVFGVWLTSVHGSLQTTLRLTNVSGN